MHVPDFVCLMQSPWHIKPCRQELLPPLLCNTLLFSLAADRLVLPAEIALMQGIHIPTSQGALQQLQACEFASPWGATDLLELVGDSGLRRLIGNGMDPSQIGVAMALLLLEALHD